MVFLVWHHGTFGMARQKNYAWHGVLPRMEKDFAMPRNRHAWW